MAYVMIHSCFAFCMEEEHVELLCSWANTDVSAWCIILSDDFLFIYSYGQQSLTHFITKSLLSQLLSSGVAHLLFLKLTWGDLLCNITWKAFNIWKDGLAFFGVNRPRVTYIWSIGTCLVFFMLVGSFLHIYICPVLCGQFSQCLSLSVLNAHWVQSLHKHGLSLFGKFAFIFMAVEIYNDIQMVVHLAGNTNT